MDNGFRWVQYVTSDEHRSWPGNHLTTPPRESSYFIYSDQRGKFAGAAIDLAPPPDVSRAKPSP
jgi:hypothetical protein